MNTKIMLIVCCVLSIVMVASAGTNETTTEFMEMANNWLTESEPNKIVNLKTFAEFAATYKGGLTFRLPPPILNSGHYYTWGISGDNLDISEGSIITEG